MRTAVGAGSRGPHVLRAGGTRRPPQDNPDERSPGHDRERPPKPTLAVGCEVIRRPNADDGAENGLHPPRRSCEGGGHAPTRTDLTASSSSRTPAPSTTGGKATSSPVPSLPARHSSSGSSSSRGSGPHSAQLAAPLARQYPRDKTLGAAPPWPIASPAAPLRFAESPLATRRALAGQCLRLPLSDVSWVRTS